MASHPNPEAEKIIRDAAKKLSNSCTRIVAAIDQMQSALRDMKIETKNDNHKNN